MRKLTLLISMLFLSLGMAWAQNYEPRETGVKTRADRLVGSISVGGDSYSLPTDGARHSYTDATDKKTFTVWAGETISLRMTQTGSWMHAFVYIDQDKNGFTAGIGADGYTPTGDLVSYSFYNNGATSDASGYNSVGNSISDGGTNTLSLPDIVAPTTPGTYRIRFKYDWCNIDPAGGQGTYFKGTFTGHGGEIIDATLIVGYPFEFVKSGRPTKWYNVALHPEQINYISVNAAGQATATQSLDGTMNSIWGFVGNPIDGFKLVNAAGKELVFGSPATVADENGTVFKVVKSTHGGSGFALQAPNSNQCLNPQGGLVKSWTLDQGCTVVLQEAELPAVAQVDGVEYATLAEAITAAPAGSTITFVDNINENVTLSKNVTIDGAGKQYTGTMTVNKDLTVTVQNVNFINGGIDKLSKQNSTTGTYTIKNCAFDGKGEYAYSLRFYGAATINVEDCTAKDNLYSLLYVPKAALNVSVKNVTVENCPNYAVYFASGVNNATIEGLTVKNSDNGFVINNTANRKLTIKNCKMENVNTAIAESKGTFAITANVQGANDFGGATLSQYAKCVLAEDATLAATTAGLNVTTNVEGKEVAYQGGAYKVVEKFYAAQVGEAKYETFAEAVAAAPAGATVELLNDATGAGVVINKNLTIDFGGKTYTANAGVGSAGTQTLALQILKGNDVTLQNGTLTSEGENIKMLINNYANLTVNNMKLVDATDHIQYVLSNNSGDVNVINGSVISSDAVALDACKYASYAAPVVTVASDAIVNGNVEVSATLKMNGTLNGNIVINGAEGKVYSTKELDVTSTVADHKLVYADGAYTVVKKFYAAQVGEQKYETLAAAVEAAEAGATVELLNDVTGAGIVIDKDLTIDFGGKTYTANAGVGSAGTQTLALQILKGNNVTLQNGTLTSEGENIKMLINNYANLTVNNMQLLDATDVIQYVLSNNCGEVAINNSVITSDAIALDACKYASYDAPVVTVDANSVVTGDVEVSATLYMNGTLTGTIIINKATGTVYGAEGLTVTTNIADHKIVRGEDGSYAVAAKNYVAQVGEDKYETFAAAVAAAPAGGTVTLIADATEAATVVLTKNLTIDGADKTFTGAIEFKKANGSFTVKNVKFNGAGNRVYALKSQASVTSLTVENCEATGYTYGFLYANKAVANAIVNNVTVKDVNYGVHSAYGTNVTLNNFVAENVKNGVMVQNYGTRNVVLNNCSFTGCETPLYIWERNQTNKITFNFEGVNEMGKADFCTSANDMAVVNAEAVAGTKVCGTLADAVEAAQAGEKVTLLGNAQLSTFLTINKSITLNMGEYNITRDGGTALYVNGDVEVVITGTTGTVTGSQALWVAKGLAKVNGGNFCGVAEAVYVTNTGKAEIYDGTFSSSNYDSFVLNKKDDSRQTASITVYGGTFVGFNPANNAAEGQGTNFVAAGLMAVDNGDGTFGIAKANIKMGDSYYATLAEAIAAIGSGDVVIELLADATLDYGAREAYGTAETTSVTINGNGKTLTLNQTNSDWSSFGLAAGNVVLNNMTIEKTGHGDTNGAWNKHAIIFSSPVEMNNVTVNNSVAVQDGATLNNVTINEAGEYYGLWINGNGQAVTVNGGAINANNGGRGIKIADQYIDAPAQVILNVTDTKFTTAKKAAVLVSSKAGAHITASNVNIENVAADKVNFVWVDEDWAQHFANVQVEGATKYQEGIEGFVAQRSNGASYKTLAAAISAATSGETITLIGDVKESVTIGKNINIDGKGRTITGTITLQGSNIVSEVKNVNFDGDNKTLYYAFSVRNTKNLTITDCTVKNYFSGLFYAPKSSTNVTVKNVTVEACGEYLAYMVSLSSATFENVTIKDSESGIIVTNSGPKKVTLKNCTMTGVDMPIEIKEKATADITFIFEGVNEMGKAEFYESQYVNVVAAAQVGTKVCGSLDTAFDAAQNGETVKILEDVTLDTKTLATQNDGYAAIINVAGKAVTLDLNGKKITVDAAAADLANASGKMLLAVFSADLGGHLTLTDNSDAKNGAVTLNVNDANVYSMFASESGQSDKSKNGKLTVNGGNYTTVGKVSNAMFFTDANEVITVNGGNFYCDGATTTASYPWMFNTYLNNEIHVTVNGGTFNVDVNHQHRPFEVYVPETLAVNANGDGTWTVVPAVAYITEMLGGTVHESGDLEHKVGYATLAAAVEAAVEGDYVTLLDDATGAGVVIDKDLTIDFAGHTYTVNKAVGSKGTETLGLQILKDNYVILTNGTLTSTAVVEGKQVKMLVQNYANLTLEDMNLVDATDHILYVLSNNSGATFLTRNTNITTNAVAFDSYYSKSYDAPTVYVETEGRIKGAIEKNDGATIAISSGTFTAEILPEWCAEYYAPVQNADGTWTVDYRYIDELTIVDDGKYTYDFVNDMTVGEFTYKRTLPAVYRWQTAYFPFEIPVEVLAEKGYEVGCFYDIHFEFNDGEINMENAPELHFLKINSGTLRANYPYLIRPTAEADLNLVLEFEDIVLHSVNDVTTVESSSTVHTFEFAGLYKRTLCSEYAGDAPCYTVTTKGECKKVAKTANLPSFRVYMTIKAKDGSPVIFDETNAPEYIKMRVIGEENEDGTTTIYDVNAEEAEEMIFDLSGRRVLETEKGIYIKNGKKVYVK